MSGFFCGKCRFFAGFGAPAGVEKRLGLPTGDVAEVPHLIFERVLSRFEGVRVLLRHAAALDVNWRPPSVLPT